MTSHKRARTTHSDTPASSPAMSSSPLDAVTQLIAERQKYEKWLEDLDAKRAQTPKHVFERVHADYEKRLQEVQDQLRLHATDMQKHAASLMSRLRDLEAAERRLSDERAEAELRSHVGEMSRGDFDSALKRAERELDRIQDEQQKIADDLNQIRSIVEGRSADEDEGEEDLPRTSEDFDELEFLKSVVGTSSHATPQPPHAPAPAHPPVSQSAPTPTASAPAVEPPAPRPAVAAAPPTAPGQSRSGEIPVPKIKPIGPPPRPQQKDTSLASNVTGNHPIQLKTDSNSLDDSRKTLKCPECGTMNTPSEWYCERCGAELAAI